MRLTGAEYNPFSDQHGHEAPGSLHHGQHSEDGGLQLGSDHLLLRGRPEGQAHHRQLLGIPEETAARRS